MFTKLVQKSASDFIEEITDFHEPKIAGDTTWANSRMTCEFNDGRPEQVVDISATFFAAGRFDAQKHWDDMQSNLLKYQLVYKQWLEIVAPLSIRDSYAWLKWLTSILIQNDPNSALLTLETTCLEPDYLKLDMFKIILLTNDAGLADFKQIHEGQDYRDHEQVGIGAWRELVRQAEEEAAEEVKKKQASATRPAGFASVGDILKR